MLVSSSLIAHADYFISLTRSTTSFRRYGHQQRSDAGRRGRCQGGVGGTRRGGHRARVGGGRRRRRRRPAAVRGRLRPAALRRAGFIGSERGHCGARRGRHGAGFAGGGRGRCGAGLAGAGRGHHAGVAGAPAGLHGGGAGFLAARGVCMRSLWSRS
ncbi:hypothetical protein PVAP13_3KG263830 [Panicum virgatum]|uniref:Uncharacterized protein n=1 Tax=Panicum virgatum TaxID=38727 RepID=A0A8T0V043_PANVG|nr:hypothetical protein PVAP13_3KG263830 [Panicum virgatum]